MNRRRSNKARRRPKASQPAETQAAEALTVAWTLSLTATVLAELAALVARVYVVAIPASELAQLLSRLLLFIAVVTGLATLSLTLPAIRIRRVAPPRAVVIIAIAVGVMPLVAVAVLWLK